MRLEVVAVIIAFFKYMQTWMELLEGKFIRMKFISCLYNLLRHILRGVLASCVFHLEHSGASSWGKSWWCFCCPHLPSVSENPDCGELQIALIQLELAAYSVTLSWGTDGKEAPCVLFLSILVKLQGYSVQTWWQTYRAYKFISFMSRNSLL